MPAAYDTIAFDRATDPLMRVITLEQARALVAYRADDAPRARIDELARLNTEGELTQAERAEYEAYARANNFIALLQAKARKLLAHSNGGH